MTKIINGLSRPASNNTFNIYELVDFILISSENIYEKLFLFQEKYNCRFKNFKPFTCSCGNFIHLHIIILHKRYDDNYLECIGRCCVLNINEELYDIYEKISYNNFKKNNKMDYSECKILEKYALDHNYLSQEELETLKISTIDNLEKSAKIYIKILDNLNFKLLDRMMTKDYIIIICKDHKELPTILQYYDQYIQKNPSNENNIYKLIGSDYMAWEKKKEKIGCLICNIFKWYDLENIYIDAGHKYDERIQYEKSNPDSIIEYKGSKYCITCYKHICFPNDIFSNSCNFMIEKGTNYICWDPEFKKYLKCKKCKMEYGISNHQRFLLNDLQENIINDRHIYSIKPLKEMFFIEIDNHFICKNCYFKKSVFYIIEMEELIKLFCLKN